MSKVRLLARSIGVDVSLDGTNWFYLFGRTDNNPQATPTKADSTDVDTDGFTSMEITLQSGVFTTKFNQLTDGGVADPAQEMVLDTQFKFGDEVRLYVRYYQTNGGSRAYSGQAVVDVQPSKTGVADLAEYQATFTFDGDVTQITNPYDPDLEPVLLAAAPSAVAVGNLLTITGQHFTGVSGASGVTIGGTNATHYTVVADTKIVAVVPAGSAGSAPVVVTNLTGASNSLPYTRGA